MNLKKLFDMQRVLRDRIGYKNHDRFEKLTLALIVEIGECANEWRGFKFWSKDQEPNTFAIKTTAFGKKLVNIEEDQLFNPLLEEYVDGLHFILELGIELEEVLNEYVEDCFGGIENQTYLQKKKTITEQFILVSNLAGQMVEDDYYCELFAAYLNLGEMLGFTDEQIEQAYYTKNEVNHQRQKQGY
ncbi:dUTP diphosphatase [Metabacillus idriensis]|uniref:dUTP diphosphatase n=1 Tax=Metabacillus idriensis TaxID=324768 RepID=UPI00203A3E98|nr:dUTP diphosphatase [Metabacillus idriensis]MCM3598989.1 dUTP diphosphatase [Metabacillus idriensis]